MSVVRRRDLDEAAVPAGTIRYRDSGEGKPVVFVHGHLVDGGLWDGVVDALGGRMRCIAADWPFGSHRLPLDAEADLTPNGVAALIASFLDALKLEDVTLVGNDTGGAFAQIAVTRHPERIGRLVLTNCDTHENFPPGLFKLAPLLASVPGGMTGLATSLRLGLIRRAAVRPFSAKRLPPELIDSWMEPIVHDLDVRRDVRKVTAAMDKRETLEAAVSLTQSELPILLAWAPGDRHFPISYARRMAEECAPSATLVEIADSKTYVPIDQPSRLAEEIARFAGVL